MQIGQRREERRKWNGREKKKRKEKKILTISPAGASEYVGKGGRKKRIERGRMGGERGRKGGRLGF